MSNSCEDSGSTRGVFVKTYSGDRSKRICTVQGERKVKHIVSIMNLMTYPGKTVCIGSIDSHPQKVKFSSTESNVSDRKWTATGAIPPRGGPTYWEHVFLIKEGPGGDNINTEVKIYWSQSQGHGKVSLSFPVVS